MSNPNKPIVAKSKAVLKELGYEVKTSHIYELFSRLSGEKSWNVAKAKNVSFEAPIRSFSGVDDDQHNKTVDDICEEILSGKATNRLYLGDHFVDLLRSPGAIFFGNSGTGKTRAMVTALSMLLASNHNNTSVFLLDSDDRDEKFSPLLIPSLRKHVHRFSSRFGGVEKLLSTTYHEMATRERIFASIDANGIEDYEEKVADDSTYQRVCNQFPQLAIPRKMSRLVIALGNISNIQKSIDFIGGLKLSKGAPAELTSIVKVGRHYGIILMTTADNPKPGDVHSVLMASIENRLVYKVDDKMASYLNAPGALSLSPGKFLLEGTPKEFPGCLDGENGNSILKSVLKRLVRPNESGFLTIKL